MILHSIVSPEYIFPYQPVNSVLPVNNGYKINYENGATSLFSTDPYNYLNGKYITDNQYLNNYINFWRNI